ncbi:hypothetical protein DYST_04656 [Dyella terrae]|nr:hypothetical protein DYST_04656 [Dyella terrae]
MTSCVAFLRYAGLEAREFAVNGKVSRSCPQNFPHNYRSYI